MGIFRRKKQVERGRIGLLKYEGTSWRSEFIALVEVEEQEVIAQFSRIKVLNVSGVPTKESERTVVNMVPHLIETNKVLWIQKAEGEQSG